ncbi:MAG: hypothetical protein ACOZF2_11425 [Thermodesulfobacteriota bacterium]
MQLARDASSLSISFFWRSGAVIVKDGVILSTGHSESALKKSSPDNIAKENERPKCTTRVLSIPNADDCMTCCFVDAGANAIAHAARVGTSLEGAIVYATVAPCLMTLQLIAQAGIKAVYFEQDYELDTPERKAYWQRIQQDMNLGVCEQILPIEAE